MRRSKISLFSLSMIISLLQLALPAEANSKGSSKQVGDGPRDMSLFKIEASVVDEGKWFAAPCAKACTFRYDADSRTLKKVIY